MTGVTDRLIGLACVEKLARALTRQYEYNHDPKYDVHKIFSCVSEPQISIYKYITRIFTSYWSNLTLIKISAVFLYRISADAGVRFHKLNTHRLFASCFVLGVKLTEEEYPQTLRKFATVSGIPSRDLACAERVLLGLINYKAHIDILELTRTWEMVEGSDLVFGAISKVEESPRKQRPPSPGSSSSAATEGECDLSKNRERRCALISSSGSTEGRPEDTPGDLWPPVHSLGGAPK